ncbi:MAG TPA: response regulator transcription factor [Planktothrix sp.]|jgi:two-component system OmpR family response regulator
MTKILVVEDDVNLAEKMRDWLVLEKHSVDLAHTGQDALQLLESYKFELLILDWELPDMAGIDVCKQYRENGGVAAVIFVTGRGSVEHREEGLDSGADDYLTKPFSVKELSARIRALMRRPALTQQNVLTVGNLRLDNTSRKVFRDSEELQLLPKELAMLEYLMRRPGQVFSSKALLDSVWPSDSSASEDTVRTYVKTLRKKITKADSPCLIKTIHGLGYKIEE